MAAVGVKGLKLTAPFDNVSSDASDVSVTSLQRR